MLIIFLNFQPLAAVADASVSGGVYFKHLKLYFIPYIYSTFIETTSFQEKGKSIKVRVK